MRTSKKIVSLVLAVMMVASMIVVGTVSASAYDTIGELDAAIRAGGDVVLDNDFTYNGSLFVPAGVTTNLDLAGHKLQSVNKDVIYNYGTLTITDSVGNGQVTAQEACVVTCYGGTTTINCKKTTIFTSKDNGVFMGNGTAGLGGCTWNIKQGTFNGNIESAGYIACGIYAPNDDTWNISGGTFNITNGVGVCQRAGTVNITGGTFNVTGDGSLGKVGDSRVVVPTGTAVVYDSKANYPAQSAEDATAITGGTFNTDQDPIAMVKADDSDPDRVTVTGGTFTDDVSAYVDTTEYKVKYTNTAGKVSYKKNIDYSNVSGSGTYQLLGDLTANSRIAPTLFASNVVIDLNGYTLTSTATDEAFLFSRAGSAANHNTYTIKNGTIISPSDGVFVGNNNVDLVLDNVTINAAGTYGVVTNGTQTGNNITATDSEITAGELGIYKPSNGSLTLTDTDVTGKTAVYVKSGDVTIDGGTFKGTGDAADYAYNGNGANITGDAVVIDNCGYPGGAPTVTIIDGVFESDNAEAVASYVKQDDPAQTGSFEQVNGFIEGGEYSSNVTDLCADGLVAEGSGSTFSIVPFTTTGKADIEGFQNKAVQADAAGNGVRILTKVDRDWLNANADSYGYVVAKVQGKDMTANFSAMKKDGGNGEKTIDCTGTYNNGIDGIDNTYVTLAVNGMSDTNQVAARFYVVVNGTTYYANYVNVATYDGIIATYAA